MDPRASDDDALLAELGAALAPSRGPVGRSVVAAGHDAFSLRLLDEALAALVYDSLREPELAGVGRAANDSRTIVFESSGVSVEMEINDEGVVGQVVPSSGVVLTAEAPDGRRSPVEADDMGCFTLPAGPMPIRLHIRAADVAAVTEWTHLDKS